MTDPGQSPQGRRTLQGVRRPFSSTIIFIFTSVSRTMSSYRGRFAPSPTGALHAGSLVAAMASFLDARAHDGVWLVRIEDIDPPRDIPGAGEHIIRTLARLGLASDEPVLWQHDRHEAYQAALDRLIAQGRVYGCACSRKEVALRAAELGLPAGVYPGTCRLGTHGRPVRAMRFLTTSGTTTFTDRLCGDFTQDVEHEVGDFVLKRADGLWAYQLAAIVDDIHQGVTDVVRGADLLDNTPRQIQLIEALGAQAPCYMHLPLVLNLEGQKLSKQQGATPLDEDDPLGELERAWMHLGFDRLGADSIHASEEGADATKGGALKKSNRLLKGNRGDDQRMMRGAAEAMRAMAESSGCACSSSMRSIVSSLSSSSSSLTMRSAIDRKPGTTTLSSPTASSSEGSATSITFTSN